MCLPSITGVLSFMGFFPLFLGCLRVAALQAIACVRALVVALSGLCIKDLVKVDVLCPAEPAFAAGKVLLLEGIVLKGKRDHIGVGGNGVDLLFPAGPKQVQALRLVQLGIVVAGMGLGFITYRPSTSTG